MVSPKYSVVIPTFNRAELLRLAVQSVLRQSVQDLEIVISNGGSTDHTRDVVAEFADERIKYFEAEQRLPVGENYQNGLNHATGDYITFLSDDDAYTPNLLETVKGVFDSTDADIVGYRYCRYYHQDLYDFEMEIPRNSLFIESHTGSLTRFSSEDALEQVLALHSLSAAKVDANFVCPYLSNATYKRSIFDALRKKRKNLFDMVPPDIYLAAAVFYESETYYCLDKPLLVWSNWEGNATATAQRKESSIRDHYSRLMIGKELEHTPLKFALPINCAANAIIEAVKENSRDDDDKLDWTEYFFKTFENFTYFRSAGIDVSDEIREFETVLSAQPGEIRKKVAEKRSNLPFRVKSLLNVQVPSVAALVRRVVGRNGATQGQVIRGDEIGFDNVVEASSFANRS